METIELKFLLKLLGFAHYRAPLSRVTPNSKTSAVERERICRKLCDRNFIACSSEITNFKIAPLGKELLQSDADELSVTPQELKILKACEKKTVTPGKTGIPEAERQVTIESLANRGLVQIDKKGRKIKEVWLTEQGKEYLLKEYDSKGAGNVTLTKKMVADYLQFLREFLSFHNLELGQTALVSSQQSTPKPSEHEILQTIDHLNWKLHTRNDLPIFYVREKLQPPLSREELDEVLFRLEKNGKIELRAIKEAWRYSNEEFFAGIPQRLGSQLFFIRLK